MLKKGTKRNKDRNCTSRIYIMAESCNESESTHIQIFGSELNNDRTKVLFS